MLKSKGKKVEGMNTSIFINIPIESIERSMAFFTALGYGFNMDYTNEKGACLVISDSIYVMLLTKEFFISFTKRDIPDPKTSAQVIMAISADSREDVDLLVDKALAAGAGTYNEPQDMGFMYSRSFADLDGHLWEVFYMDEDQA